MAPTSTTSHEPILGSWKISEVLNRHPDLLETFIGLSPAFAKLRNPLLRRVQTRLVTVADAAAIAGMEPARLVQALNASAGLTAPGSIARPAAQERPGIRPDWFDSTPVAAEIDVRPLMASGKEPFKEIMRLAAKVRPGQVLRLIASFEPVPLYDALGRQSFTAWAEQHAPDRWEVQFLKGETVHAPAAPVRQEPAALDWTAPTQNVTIDVSELVPPEPMIKILEALEMLPAGGRLLVHHLRRPMHLYPRLDEMGCQHETRELAPGRVEVLIQKPADLVA